MKYRELVIPCCEYGIPHCGPGGVYACEKPAVAEVWWLKDKSDKMYVCEEHLEKIQDSEVEKVDVNSIR